MSHIHAVNAHEAMSPEMMTMVTWMQANNAEITTRVYTRELIDFVADIESAGGYLMEMRDES